MNLTPKSLEEIRTRGIRGSGPYKPPLRPRQSGGTSAKRKREGVGRFACPKFLTKHENSPKYFIQASGTSAFNLCYSIKAQLREIIMINFTFGVPVKTRLPLRAWMLAAIATLFSLASSLLHSPTPVDNPLYAGMIWRLVWPS